MKLIIKIFLFFLLTVTVFSLMYYCFYITGADESIKQFIRDTFTKIFNTGNQLAIFEPSSELKEWDTKLYLHRADIYDEVLYQFFDVKTIGYSPLLLFVSLVIVYPVSLFRRFTSFFVGIILMFIYMNLMAGLIVRNLIFKIRKVGGVEYSSFFDSLNSTLYDILVVNGFEWTIFFPVVIWMVTSVKLSDLDLKLPSTKSNKK